MQPSDLTAVEARRLFACKKLSPVELAQSCIARIEAVDHAVNAVVARDFEAMMQEARAAEAAIMAGKPLGQLHGLPVAIKDMNDVAGLPTTFGSEIFAGNIAAADDAMVAALRRSGAIIAGKTNNPEWSAGGNTRNLVYGATVNPYDTSKSCAGSSGGSAVALACGMTPLATGSDMGGSLRNPAAWCGVVGFRPTPGVVPGDTRGIGLLPLGQVGPMARCVADAALLLSVQMQMNRMDPWVSVIDGKPHLDAGDFTRLRRVDLSQLRIAVTEDFGFAMTERIIRESFAGKIARLDGLFATMEPKHPDCRDCDQTFAILRGVTFLGAFHDMMKRHPDKIGPNVRVNVEEALGYSALDVADALTRQTAYYRKWQDFFATTDYILTPAVTISPRDWHELYPAQIDGAPTRSYYQWLALAYASTLAGHPSVTIPAGFDTAGMPFGLQIIGRKGDDAGTLAVAAELETLFAGDDELRRRGPDIEALETAPPIREAPGFMGF